jgi:hypothetical protein
MDVVRRWEGAPSKLGDDRFDGAVRIQAKDAAVLDAKIGNEE